MKRLLPVILLFASAASQAVDYSVTTTRTPAEPLITLDYEKSHGQRHHSRKVLVSAPIFAFEYAVFTMLNV